MSNLSTSIIADSIKDVHKNFIATLDGVTDEVSNFMPEGKANPIAGTYAHMVFSEDFFINGLIQGKTPLFESEEFKDKTGASEVQPSDFAEAYPKWLKEVTLDLESFATYRDAVFAQSEKYIESLTAEDLEKEIDMSMFGMGGRPLHNVLTGIIIGHAASIMGEISVLKGIQGLKGYPF